MAAKQKSGAGGSFDVKDAISSAYKFKLLNDLLDNDMYDYELRNKTDKLGNSLRVIKISPKDAVEKDLYEGSVTYDSKSQLILEVDIHKAASHQKFSREINILVAKVKIFDLNKKSSFRIDGNKYVMVYNKTMIDFHLKMGKKYNDTFRCLSDVYVLDYKDGEFQLPREKRFRENSLYLAGNKFTDEFWKTNNVILLSEAEETIISALN